MKTHSKEISVFSTAAVDLFASALGAFILLVMLLFPYYQHAGPEESASDTAELLQKRRQAVRSAAESMAEVNTTEQKVAELEAQADQLRRDMVSMESELFNIKKKMEEVEPEEPAPVVEEQYSADGVEFSILGIGTERKKFLIVIDMSGSMTAYADLMVQSVLEILQPLNDENEFAILGYHGDDYGGPTQYSNFPGGSRLVPATSANLQSAVEFTRSLTGNFIGSTPTHEALLNAVQYPADAIILISDGAPDTDPGIIIDDITQLNRRMRKEIHTVALGDYTNNKQLVLFLQKLAALNRGDFVGVSR